MSELKARLTQAMKDAMRAKDKPRLQVIRMALAAFKQIEIDSQAELDEAGALAVLDKQIKQRDDALTQYQQANRADLADIEQYEAIVLREFLPAQLTDEDIAALVKQVIADTNAQGMQSMGKVMAVLKPELQGRANMGDVSKLVKSLLA